jgi:hypothetical protein
MIRDYDILIDVTTGRLIRDVNSDVQIQPRPFVQGDTYNVRVKACQPRPGRPIGRVYDYVELPEAIYVALGDVGQRPESGQFTLTYDGDTTAPLVYNASPAQVQAALALLDSIVAAGGVTVAGEAGGPYQVTFAQAGVREAFQATTAGLYPPTGSTVYDARTGTAEIASVQIIALDRQSAALAVTFTDLPEPTGSVTEIQAGSDTTREIQRVTISSDTYDGTFALAFDGASTGALPYNIEALDLQSALEAVETWGEGVTVTGAFPTWDITFGGDPANKALSTIDISGLKVPIGKQGELALTTAGIEAIVAGQAVANTKLEVAVVEDAKHATLLQVDAAVLNDGIQNAPETGPTLPEYYTKPEVDALVDGLVTEEQLDDLQDQIDDLNNEVIIYKTSNQTFTSNTMVDDSVFQFEGEPNTKYEINIFLLVQVADADLSGGMKLELTKPSGASLFGNWVVLKEVDGEPVKVTPPASPNDPEPVQFITITAVDNADCSQKMLLTIGSTGGTCKFRFGLVFNDSSGSVRANSYLSIRKLNV